MQTGSVSSTDPANRLTWMLSAMGGSAPAWRGGVAGGVWYGARPNLRGETFWIEQRATQQRDAARTMSVDLRLAGASLAAELPVTGSSSARRIGLSAFVGTAQRRGDDARTRLLLTGHYRLGVVTGWRASAGVGSRAAAGRLGDSTFARASVNAYVNAFGTRVDTRLYRASDGTPWLEQFSAGGFAPPLNDDATLAQRIAIPALPAGLVHGRTLYEFRVTRPAPYIPATMYAQSVGTSANVSRHSALIGIEQGIDLDYLGLVGLPRLHALAGVARIVRGPLQDKGSAYLTLGWRP